MRKPLTPGAHIPVGATGDDHVSQVHLRAFPGREEGLAGSGLGRDGQAVFNVIVRESLPEEVLSQQILLNSRPSANAWERRVPAEKQAKPGSSVLR